MKEGENIKAGEAVTPAANSAAEKTLVCFDFDNTIVNGHFHSELYDNGRGKKQITNSNGVIILDGRKIENQNPSYNEVAVEESVAKLLETTGGFKNKDKLLETFRTMFEQGHDVAITSFTKYPHVIKPTLRELGLTEDEVAKIQVIGGFPSEGANNPSSGKKEHIDAAMKASGITGNIDNIYSKVILIDDSKDNIDKAKKIGANVVKVPKIENSPPDYLDEAIKKGQELQQKYRGAPAVIVEKQVTANESITPETPKISAAEAITPNSPPATEVKAPAVELKTPNTKAAGEAVTPAAPREMTDAKAKDVLNFVDKILDLSNQQKKIKNDPTDAYLAINSSSNSIAKLANKYIVPRFIKSNTLLEATAPSNFGIEGSNNGRLWQGAPKAVTEKMKESAKNAFTSRSPFTASFEQEIQPIIRVSIDSINSIQLKNAFEEKMGSLANNPQEKINKLAKNLEEAMEKRKNMPRTENKKDINTKIEKIKNDLNAAEKNLKNFEQDQSTKLNSLSTLHNNIVKNCASAEDRKAIHEQFIDGVTKAEGLTDMQKQKAITSATKEYDKANVTFQDVTKPQTITQAPPAVEPQKATPKEQSTPEINKPVAEEITPKAAALNAQLPATPNALLEELKAKLQEKGAKLDKDHSVTAAHQSSASTPPAPTIGGGRSI